MLSLKLMLAAVFRITAASACVTASEMAAWWWARKPLGDAAGAVHRAVVRAGGDGGLAEHFEYEGEGGEEGAGGLAAQEQHAVALGERAGVVA